MEHLVKFVIGFVAIFLATTYLFLLPLAISLATGFDYGWTLLAWYCVNLFSAFAYILGDILLD
jgi:hypothetical protein